MPQRHEASRASRTSGSEPRGSDRSASEPRGSDRDRTAARLLARLLAVALALLGATAAGAQVPLTPFSPVRVLVMLVDGNQPLSRDLRHYENNQVTNTTWSSPATIQHFAFERNTSFAEIYYEMSFGQVTLTGDTVLMHLPYDAGDFNWLDWVALADAEAENLGYDLSQYDRFLYQLPGLPKDAFTTGLADDTRGWCTQTSRIELGCLFHELGHTLGFVHGSEIQPDGSIQAYGDVSDGLMGSGFNCHVNAVNKYRAGWLGGARLATFDAPGSAGYTIQPQSLGTPALQTVRIVNKGARPGVGVVDTFVSYRDTEGFDEQLLQSFPDVYGDDAHDAVLVHQGFRLTGGDALYLAALEPGEVYSENGVTVEANAISSSSAVVTVSRDPHHPAAPDVAVIPPGIDSQPWNTQFFSVSITNLNPVSQAFDSLYDVTLSSPGPDWNLGWTSTAPKTVAPGTTRDFSFFVTPPSQSPLGAYAIDVVATDPDGDSGPVVAAAQAIYNVAGPLDTTPPSVPTGGTINPIDADSVFVTWTASADDLSGVNGYDVLWAKPYGRFEIIGSTGWPGYIDDAWTPNRSYRVRARDRAGNVSGWSAHFPAPPPGACGLGFELAALLPALRALRSRRRGRA